MDSEWYIFLTPDKPKDVVVYKERNSKYIGCAFPLKNEAGVKPIICGLQKEHPTASHACYGWQAGTDAISYRVNVDGEPYKSAGMPIYGKFMLLG